MSKKLRKELGLLEVICISTGAMISSGLFILPALAYSQTGASVVLSYLIASILVIPTILAKAELVTALPRTGGDFIFVDRSMGPLAGMFSGMAAWFSKRLLHFWALLYFFLFSNIISRRAILSFFRLFVSFFLLYLTFTELS